MRRRPASVGSKAGLDKYEPMAGSNFQLVVEQRCHLTASRHDTVWPVKSRQMSIKVPKKDFSSKMKDFDTITKIA